MPALLLGICTTRRVTKTTPDPQIRMYFHADAAALTILKYNQRFGPFYRKKYLTRYL